VTALAHPRRKIDVAVVDKKTLLTERTELLKQVGCSTAEALFDRIKHGNFSVKDRITAERLEAINWLLDPDA